MRITLRKETRIWLRASNSSLHKRTSTIETCVILLTPIAISILAQILYIIFFVPFFRLFLFSLTHFIRFMCVRVCAYVYLLINKCSIRLSLRWAFNFFDAGSCLCVCAYKLIGVYSVLYLCSFGIWLKVSHLCHFRLDDSGFSTKFHLVSSFQLLLIFSSYQSRFSYKFLSIILRFSHEYIRTFVVGVCAYRELIFACLQSQIKH